MRVIYSPTVDRAMSGSSSTALAAGTKGAPGERTKDSEPTGA
jgi:hypothetical protein